LAMISVNTLTAVLVENRAINDIVC